ncbi:MAG: GGDEF domain-containing protein, partial [Porphyrobacter sp.]|nr:GGDEF domain-containing protein [Porphyrobacter sp.]
AAATVWGAAQRMGLASPLIGYAVIGVMTALFSGLAAWLGQPRVLMLAQNTGSSLIFMLGAMVLWGVRSTRLLDRVLIWVMALFAAHGFSRPLEAMLFETGLETLRFGASNFQAINVVIIGVLSVAMAMIMLAQAVQDNFREEQEAATIDPLSGLMMRRAFEAAVRAAVARAKPRGRPLSLIVADIDYFKAINDTHGHAVGDQVIASFGQLLANKIRPSDLAGRIGGEEFCVLAWNCQGHAAAALAERIRAAVREFRGRAGNVELTLSASFGVAQWHAGETFGEVFARADAALYEAKNCGRNRVVFRDCRTMPGAVSDGVDTAPVTAANISVLER